MRFASIVRPGRLRIAALCAAAVLVSMLGARAAGAAGMLERVRAGADDAQAIALGAVGRVLDAMPFAGADARARRRIDMLELRLREQAHWRTTARRLTERVREYEQRLGLESRPGPEGLWSRIVAEPGGPFAPTRLIDVGTAQGARIGDAALADNRLIGRVVRVGRRGARLLPLDSPDSRVPVMAAVSRRRAILAGERHGLARLSHFSDPDPPEEEEIWLTSGEGGLFRRGWVVGRARPDGQGGWFLHTPAPREPWLLLVPGPTFPDAGDDPGTGR